MEHNTMSVNNAQFNFLRMTFKVLVPVSLFFFLISQYSSLFLPLLLHSADEYFSSSFSVNQLFRYSSDRNYMFLLCNGILVLIIKNSGLVALPQREKVLQFSHQTISPQTYSRKKVLHISHETVSTYSSEIATGEPKVVEVKSTEEEEAGEMGDEIVNSIDHQEEEERKEGYDEIVIFTDHHQEEEERKKGDDERVIYSDHHEEEEEEELSNEELNKKCEEFIHRMKQNMSMRK